MSTFTSYIQGPYSITTRNHRTNEHGQALPDLHFVVNADDVMDVKGFDSLHDALTAKTLLNKAWFAALQS